MGATGLGVTMLARRAKGMEADYDRVPWDRSVAIPTMLLTPFKIYRVIFLRSSFVDLPKS